MNEDAVCEKARNMSKLDEPLAQHDVSASYPFGAI